MKPKFLNPRFVPHAMRGFTLTEMMIVVIVAAILTVVAVPSFREFVANQRIKNASFDLVSTLSFARSEAIKRNANVSVNAAATGWSDGWTVVEAAGGTTLNQQNAISGLTISAGANTLTYAPNGRLSTAQLTFEISVAGVTAATPRCISVDLSGRPNSKIKSGGAC